MSSRNLKESGYKLDLNLLTFFYYTIRKFRILRKAIKVNLRFQGRSNHLRIHLAYVIAYWVDNPHGGECTYNEHMRRPTCFNELCVYQ